jgi:hypothetical protein
MLRSLARSYLLFRQNMRGSTERCPPDFNLVNKLIHGWCSLRFGARVPNLLLPSLTLLWLKAKNNGLHHSSRKEMRYRCFSQAPRFPRNFSYSHQACTILRWLAITGACSMICTESGGAYYREQTKGGFRGAGLKTGEEEKKICPVPFLMVFRDGRAHRKVRIPPILTLLTHSFSGSLELRCFSPVCLVCTGRSAAYTMSLSKARFTSTTSLRFCMCVPCMHVTMHGSHDPSA